MKQSDIFTLILIAGIGTLAAFFLCNAIMGDPNLATAEFKALTNEISSELVAPDPEIFNGSAINPTVEVYVGDCEDIDQNGILDMAELIACGREEAPVDATWPREQLEALRDSDACILDVDQVQLCDEEKRVYIDGLLNPSGE